MEIRELHMSNPVVLEDQIQSRIDRLVSSGQFKSFADVVAQGVTLIEERDARIGAFNAAINEGWTDSQTGAVYDMDTAFDEIEAKLRAKVADRAA
jgi:antitoxin ParD1/3/4